MTAPIDIPYADIMKMMDDLVRGPLGEGFEPGRRFAIQRYTSRTTGKVYDCVFVGGEEPKCAEIPDAARPAADPNGVR